MKKFSLLIVLFLITVTLLLVSNIKVPSKNQKVNNLNINIGDVQLVVDVADTALSRKNGLSKRESLGDGQGMLFVFPKEGKYGFWMKDMKFPIDIIWINNNLEVIGVEKNVTPESYPTAYYPPDNVRFVLEVPGGFFDRAGLKIDERMLIESQNLEAKTQKELYI